MNGKIPTDGEQPRRKRKKKQKSSWRRTHTYYMYDLLVNITLFAGASHMLGGCLGFLLSTLFLVFFTFFLLFSWIFWGEFFFEILSPRQKNPVGFSNRFHHFHRDLPIGSLKKPSIFGGAFGFAPELLLLLMTFLG